MDLSTTYLGLLLPHPIMVGAGPIVDDMSLVRRAEDAGAAAITMHSLFEEQVMQDALEHREHVERHTETHAEAQSFLPPAPGVDVEYVLGPDEYLERLRRIKDAVSVPVIGSLNGVSDHGWLSYASLIEEAGADALELNVYYLAMDPNVSGQQVEQRLVDVVRAVCGAVSIPVSVKLSSAYSSLPHLARQLVDAGAKGLVLFNRFYEPDIDVEQLELGTRLELSNPAELMLRLRWLAALHDTVPVSLAVTGGVHGPLDALKAVMAGASGVQMTSALLRHGVEHLAVVRGGLQEWLEQHEYDSLQQALGSMSLNRCPDPTYYHRGNYLRILQSWARERM